MDKQRKKCVSCNFATYRSAEDIPGLKNYKRGARMSLEVGVLSYHETYGV